MVDHALRHDDADVPASQPAENAAAAMEDGRSERGTNRITDRAEDRRELRADRAGDERAADDPQHLLRDLAASPAFENEHDCRCRDAERDERVVRANDDAAELSENRMHGRAERACCRLRVIVMYDMSMASRHSGPPIRLTARTGVAAVLCALGVVGVSCQGSNCATAPGNPPPLSNELASLYFLTSINQAGLPTIYADSATFHLRVWSDSLKLVLATSNYSESGRVSRIDPVSGEELIHNFALAGTHVFSTDASGRITIPAFLGGTGIATPQAGYGHALLQVSAGGKTWLFNPGPQ